MELLTGVEPVTSSLPMNKTLVPEHALKGKKKQKNLMDQYLIRLSYLGKPFLTLPFLPSKITQALHSSNKDDKAKVPYTNGQ
ncbi:hypothetical protein [Endozoicomonas sp.]|uniref:hypothetical protein n=1 Tax=Endozoicomonas sp. TaxID=1892382 RepID=UPI002888CE51|nr:hypothetical protein [Endozoicomonas sp.]